MRHEYVLNVTPENVYLQTDTMLRKILIESVDLSCPKWRGEFYEFVPKHVRESVETISAHHSKGLMPSPPTPPNVASHHFLHSVSTVSRSKPSFAMVLS